MIDMTVTNLMNDSVSCANLPIFPVATSRAGGAIINGTLVLCASWTVTLAGYPKECYKFDRMTNQWSKLAEIGADWEALGGLQFRSR